MPLRLYNTLTRRKEEFAPLQPGRVGMYVCGPTVYGHSHIGHAKSYVSFDVVQRYLRHLGYAVTYVQNITDVGHLVGDADEGEDKVEREARQMGVSPFQIAQMYERSYWEDMDALGVQRPDISCRATGHVLEQIALVQRLVERGFAYEVNGSVYFAVARDRAYGKLSNRKPDEMEAGARVGVREEKRNPLDFALWKRADPTHVMQWDSPWGRGFPGWHVECSAMSMKYLGESFDIHGGGIENQFPHHECEIAQSECATGHQFVKYWLHNNMVTVDGKKMGKSLGNTAGLKELFRTYAPLTLRFFILQSHYRSTLEFKEEAIAAAAQGMDKLLHTVRRIREVAVGDGPPALDGPFRGEIRAFTEAMDDDFNTAVAISSLFDIARRANAVLDGSVPDRWAILAAAEVTLRDLGGRILGIIPEVLTTSGTETALVDGLVGMLIDLRNQARARRDFAESDRLRDSLAALGITLEDGKGGTVWRQAR